MTAPMGCRLVGRWRIVEADLWDRDYLDLVAPATMTIGADGHGEIAYGALQASLALESSRSIVFFTWAGFDEMDEVTAATRLGDRHRSHSLVHVQPDERDTFHAARLLCLRLGTGQSGATLDHGIPETGPSAQQTNIGSRPRLLTRMATLGWSGPKLASSIRSARSKAALAPARSPRSCST